ncbi:hypothetical protein FHR24_001596 [Wenyingzhuangia heitensis]|uniref:Outer membrane protein beta-barrel domain-containing protein n=1 Tax=Wenyingzhuangia heitensis TaxID=1487859 RepID=A0ABX0U8I9_9FLAO|nr:hypothetical protein [Wenyingzhuangia heitensis]NIJ45157.1 hypothetical protein [Wenyingzhuangia heitensis]
MRTSTKGKILTLMCAIGLGVASANAQTIANNAIGIRAGDNDGFGSEISYQRALGNATRLELDLGWRNTNNYDAMKFSAIHQWVYPIENRFNWFVGAGGGIGFFDNNNINNDDEVFVVASGDIGIEYNFKIPLIISLDLRPEVSFNNDYSDGLDIDTALGIRYQF